MRTIQIYCCEKCNYQSSDRDACLAHEATHFRLTVAQYDKWRELTRAAEHAGSVCGSTSNPETRRNFDNAIRDLVDYEQQHHLPDMRPRHF